MAYDLQSHLMMASVDFARLQAFVQNLRIKMKADGALFRYLDYNDGSYPITLDCGSGVFSQAFFEDYDSSWGFKDPHIRVALNRKLPDRTVYICSEHYPPNERGDDPYFSEFLPKHNIQWFAGYLAQVDNEYGAGFAIVRAPGREPFTLEDREFLQPLVYILEDCVRMLLHGQRTRLACQAMEMAMQENTPHAACIDAQGRILWKSTETVALFEEFRALQIKGGRFVSRSVEGDGLLGQIKSMARLNAGNRVPAAQEITIPRENSPAIAFTMHALRSESGALGAAGLGACMLMGKGGMGRQGRNLPAGSLGVLTKTELEIAGRIAEGMTAPKIATELGVQPSTVRTHMKHAYRKLGINSKAELAALYIRNQKK